MTLASIECATLKIEEAATFLGISWASAYAAANSGELPTLRIGRRLVVPRAALERLLASAGQRPEGGVG